MLELSAAEVRERLGRGEAIHFLDVREHREVEERPFPEAEHIPMMSLFLGIRQPACDKDVQVVIVCEHGIRSFEVASFLRIQGYPNAWSLAGGLDAWEKER